MLYLFIGCETHIFTIVGRLQTDEQQKTGKVQDLSGTRKLEEGLRDPIIPFLESLGTLSLASLEFLESPGESLGILEIFLGIL